MKFISPLAHSIIGFIVGLVLVLAPTLFGFSDVGGAAVVIPRVLGVIVMLAELTVKGSFSTFGFVPMSIHIPMDVVMGIFLAASPWLFGFTVHGTHAWLPHFIVGILMIGYALVTRTNTEEAELQTHPL